MARTFLAMAVLLVAGASAQAQLTVTNIQAVSPLGSVEWQTLEYHRNDDVRFRFEVRGARPDFRNQVDLEATIKLTDIRGEIVARRTAHLQSLSGAESVSGEAGLDLDGQVNPGQYTATVTVTDNLSYQEVRFERVITVKPNEFAISGLTFSHDEEGKQPAYDRATFVGPLYYRMQITGCDCSRGQIDLKIRTAVLDAAVRQPICLHRDADVNFPVTGSDSGATVVGGSLHFVRPGKFLIRVVVTDQNTKKTTQIETPIEVRNP